MRRALLLLVVLAGCAQKPPPTFRTDEVSRGEIVEAVSATGEVGALVTVSVGTQVSGTVLRLYADFNSPVRRGQLLAELDPRLLKAALSRAEAGLAAALAEVERAKVTLADAERTRDRAAKLVEKQLVAEAELDAAGAARDAARANVKVFEARVLQARAEAETAATNLSLAKITSPIDGIVISRSIDVGQTVAATLQSPTLFTIANDLTRMQILANVDEADIGRVSAGLETRLTVDAFPGEPFAGRIREVRAAPTTVSNVVTYAAVIDAPNPDRKLRQGMTASVSIVLGRRDDVLRLPNAALRWTPSDAAPGPGGKGGGAPREGGEKRRGRPEKLGESELAAKDAPERKVRRATVYKLGAGQPEPVEVTLGLGDGRFTEILGGLAEGDRVVVGDGGARPGGGPGGGSGGGRRGLF